MTKIPGETETVDLSALDTAKACNNAFELELVHPITGKKLGQFISVIGKDSDAFQEEIANRVNQTLREQAFNARKGKDTAVKTVQDRERENIEMLVLCTTGFRNVNLGGPLEFSIPNALKLYTDLKFVRDQVDAAIADISNFMKV